MSWNYIVYDNYFPVVYNGVMKYNFLRNLDRVTCENQVACKTHYFNIDRVRIYMYVI